MSDSLTPTPGTTPRPTPVGQGDTKESASGADTKTTAVAANTLPQEVPPPPAVEQERRVAKQEPSFRKPNDYSTLTLTDLKHEKAKLEAQKTSTVMRTILGVLTIKRPSTIDPGEVNSRLDTLNQLIQINEAKVAVDSRSLRNKSPNELAQILHNVLTTLSAHQNQEDPLNKMCKSVLGAFQTISPEKSAAVLKIVFTDKKPLPDAESQALGTMLLQVWENPEPINTFLMKGMDCLLKEHSTAALTTLGTITSVKDKDIQRLVSTFFDEATKEICDPLTKRVLDSTDREKIFQKALLLAQLPIKQSHANDISKALGSVKAATDKDPKGVQEAYESAKRAVQIMLVPAGEQGAAKAPSEVIFARQMLSQEIGWLGRFLGSIGLLGHVTPKDATQAATTIVTDLDKFLNYVSSPKEIKEITDAELKKYCGTAEIFLGEINALRSDPTFIKIITANPDLKKKFEEDVSRFESIARPYLETRTINEFEQRARKVDQTLPEKAQIAMDLQKFDPKDESIIPRRNSLLDRYDPTKIRAEVLSTFAGNNTLEQLEAFKAQMQKIEETGLFKPSERETSAAINELLASLSILCDKIRTRFGEKSNKYKTIRKAYDFIILQNKEKKPDRLKIIRDTVDGLKTLLDGLKTLLDGVNPQSLTDVVKSDAYNSMVAQFDKITIDKFCELTIASEKAKDLQATFEEKQDLIETDILEQKFSSATTIIEKADVLLALQNLKPKTQVGRKKREELIESYKNKVVTTDSPISSHSLTYHSPVEDFVNAQEELKKLEESKTLSKKDLDAEKKLYVEKFLTTEQPIDPNLFLKTKSSLSERLKTLDRKPRDPIFKLAKDLDTTIQKMRTALADIEKTCEELTILTDIEQAIRRQMSLVEEAKNAVQLDQFDPKVPVAKTLKRKIQGDHSIDASRKFILEELKKRKAAISGKTPIGEIEKLLNEIGEIGKTMLFSEEQTQEFNGLKQSVSTLKDSRSLP